MERSQVLLGKGTKSAASNFDYKTGAMVHRMANKVLSRKGTNPNEIENYLEIAKYRTTGEFSNPELLMSTEYASAKVIS